MKKIFNIKLYSIFLLAGFVLVTGTGCEKDKDGVPSGKPSENPQATGFEVDSASNGTVIILNGSGLADMRSIVFDKNNTPAIFSPNFNTDYSLVFRVPDTAAGGLQNVIFTNSIGKSVSVPFKVIALPNVTGASDYSFTASQSITLTGLFLNDVSRVVISGTSVPLTITDQTKTSVTFEMPASVSAASVKFDVTNESGTITTTQEFINADQAFVFFRDGFENGEQDAAWGDPGAPNTAVKISGSASYGKKFANGNWHQMGFGWNNISNAGGYQYLSFWMRGGNTPISIWISSSASPNGFASFNDFAKIDLPVNEWKYFKLKLSDLQLWATSAEFNQLGWRLQGPNSGDETLYLDDVMFIK